MCKTLDLHQFCQLLEQCVVNLCQRTIACIPKVFMCFMRSFLMVIVIDVLILLLLDHL